MSGYVEIIKDALIFFPFIALLISVPFILIQYHKYGSISFFKGLIIYSFTLYFICAYFLVILPLPKREVVSALTTPRMQLIPFRFILDFIKHTSLNITDIHTYITAIKQTYFFVPVYNILLTLPFGIYLKYYFNCNLKKTILFSFLLSLFFELTQLSGLYFIYSRGYRLFDIDDLLLNTLGGVVGYFISKPVIKVLPKIEEIDTKAKQRGKVISGLRRTTTLGFDFFLFLLLETFISLFIKFKYIFGTTLLIYYFIIPILFKYQTPAQKFLNIKTIDYNDKNNILRIILRRVLFILIYILLPLLLAKFIYNLSINTILKEVVGLIYFGIIFIFYFITGIKYVFTSKEMIFEKLTKTKLISTIKQE